MLIQDFRYNQLTSETHLWLVRDAASEPLLEQYRDVVNEEEFARLHKFLFARDRVRFLQTRAAIRHLLSMYHVEVSPQDWQFKNNQYGRPEIANTLKSAPVNFNISHTQGLIVIAVSRSGTPGVDVEDRSRSRRTLEVANRYFSGAEVAALDALPVAEQGARFFDLWTLKEAYIKACGMGLAIPLHHFTFSFPQADRIAISFSEQRQDDAQRWHFWQLDVGADYALSLALLNDKQGSFSEQNTSVTLRSFDYVPAHCYQEIELPVLKKS